MYEITETNDFESIYWHDSMLISIEFDVLKNSVSFCIDLNISNVQNNISYQPCVATFNNVSNFRLNLEWESACVGPEIAFIERELIEKPKHFIDNLDFYCYTLHFLDPAIGKIELPLVTEFKLATLSEPIVFEGEEDYFKKRAEVMKNYLINHTK
ncbi:MAG TPA: hypothetical protein PKE39_01115 [Ignavibacteria bacterium]|nr:hypothetical protein [Ignavibacteria bacterium]HMQ97596.1 hypothetical protein [Ignavibacteria bacterium]